MPCKRTCNHCNIQSQQNTEQKWTTAKVRKEFYGTELRKRKINPRQRSSHRMAYRRIFHPHSLRWRCSCSCYNSQRRHQQNHKFKPHFRKVNSKLNMATPAKCGNTNTKAPCGLNPECCSSGFLLYPKHFPWSYCTKFICTRLSEMIN